MNIKYTDFKRSQQVRVYDDETHTWETCEVLELDESKREVKFEQTTGEWSGLEFELTEEDLNNKKLFKSLQ